MCCSAYNRSDRKPVVCGRCGYASCGACARKYILECAGSQWTGQSVPCMHCRQPWGRAFLEANFTKKFVGTDLKQRREDLLFEVERALLPETQPHAEAVKARRDLTARKKALMLERDALLATPGYVDINRRGADPTVYSASAESFEVWREVQPRLAPVCAELNCIEMALLRIAEPERVAHYGARRNNIAAAPAPAQRRAFIKPCPAAGCRGFLSTGWKCGLCDTKVCATCHEITRLGGADVATAEHVCDPAIVASVRVIAKDSKPCPKCGEIIQRISGCPMMYHTPLSGGCGASFNWNTLKLYEANAGVHNPHWFEYQAHLRATQPQGHAAAAAAAAAAAGGACGRGRRCSSSRSPWQPAAR